MADDDGHQVLVTLRREVLEHFHGRKHPSKDESILQLVRHQHELEQATARAMLRQRRGDVLVIVGLPDLLN